MSALLSSLPAVPRTAAPVQTPYGVLSAPASRVAAYVHSSGVQDLDDDYIRANTVTTLNEGLRRCRSGRGDVVYVMPGHAESISSADQMSNLKAGTNIVGLGHGSLRPTFTWTAATATFLFDVANVTLSNCVLDMAGGGAGTALTVAAPITISAAGCGIYDCKMVMGHDADEIVTIGVTTTAAADDLVIAGCQVTSPTAAECTTCFRFVGADGLRFVNNTVLAATSSTTVGVVQFLTTASTNIEVGNSYFENRKALSVHAMTGMAGLTGVVHDCGFGILDTATLAGFVTPGSTSGYRNKTVNTAGEQGGGTATVSA